MSRSSLYAAMAMYGFAALDKFYGGPKPEPPEKPCRNCGTMKRHNNDYCSAKCCKEFRARKAAVAKVEIERLKAINAELLAACKQILNQFRPKTADDQWLAMRVCEAIKKATGEE